MSDALHRCRPILLVENDDVQREAVVEMLAFMGYDVLSAGSGEEALRLLQTNTVSVLVAGLDMPGMSGAELAIRAVDLMPGIDVIFTTDKAYLVSAPLPFKFSLLAKPFHYATLQDKLNHLGMKHQDEAA